MESRTQAGEEASLSSDNAQTGQRGKTLASTRGKRNVPCEGGLVGDGAGADDGAVGRHVLLRGDSGGVVVKGCPCE